MAVMAGEFLLNQADGDKAAAEAALHDRMVPNVEVIINVAQKTEDGLQPQQ
jgi:hypothetical protein